MKTSTPKSQKHVRFKYVFLVAETSRMENGLHEIFLKFDVTKEHEMQFF